MGRIRGEKAEGGQSKGKRVRWNKAKGKKNMTRVKRNNIFNLEYKTLTVCATHATTNCITETYFHGGWWAGHSADTIFYSWSSVFKGLRLCNSHIRKKAKWENCISRYKRQELTLLMLMNVLPKEKLCNFIIAQINKQVAKLAITAC